MEEIESLLHKVEELKLLHRKLADQVNEAWARGDMSRFRRTIVAQDAANEKIKALRRRVENLRQQIDCLGDNRKKGA